MAGQDGATPEKLPRRRPMPMEVKGAILLSAVKSATMTTKMPYVLVGVFQDYLGVAFFQSACAVCSLLGAWLMPRLSRHCSPFVTTWFTHCCGFLSNGLNVVWPDSMLPILPSNLAPPTAVSTAVVAGSIEHHRATDEESAEWGAWASGVGVAAASLAPLVAVLVTPVFYHIHLLCFIAEVLATALLLISTLPKAQAPGPPSWSWGQTQRMRLLRTLAGIWMFTFHVLQALEFGIWEMSIVVYSCQRLQPSALQVQLLVACGMLGAQAYTAIAGAPVQRWCTSSPRLVLIGLQALGALMRWMTFRVPSMALFIVMAGFAQFFTAMMNHLRSVMWSFIALKDEPEGPGVLQGIIGQYASVACPMSMLLFANTFTAETLWCIRALSAVVVTLYGLLGLCLLIPGEVKPKEE
uniref:Uncharacterized protein n=1 Tax=Alexandrium monilatum TaxID=311494 RepID=A0A7S4UZK8_9DINO